MRQFFGIRKWHTVGLLRFLNCILFSGAAVLAASANTNAQEVTGEKVWTLPAPVDDLVYARRFTLTEGYRWNWRADEPATEVGVIVVLRVDPQLVIPRNSLSPILYAGDRMVQALNFGHKSGNVIGIIPGEVNFLQTPIWFGSPRVPGLVSAQSIRAQRALAEKAGIRPFPAKKIERVTKAPVEAPDLDSLLRGELADLVLEYAPEESHLARKWRLPEAKAKHDPSRPGVVKPGRERPELE